MNFLKALFETYNSFEWVVMGWMVGMLSMYVFFKLWQAKRRKWRRNVMDGVRHAKDLHMASIKYHYSKKGVK